MRELNIHIFCLSFICLSFIPIQDENNKFYPSEIIESRCYLLDTVSIDTLYISKLVSGKRDSRRYFPVCSDSILGNEIKQSELSCNQRIYLFADQCLLKSILSEIHWNRVNSPKRQTEESWMFYKLVGDQCETLPGNIMQEEKCFKLIGSKYFLLLINGEMLSKHTTEGDFGIHNAQNLFFKLLCPTGTDLQGKYQNTRE